eukprot:6215792-Prymnesium_polylepis.1
MTSWVRSSARRSSSSSTHFRATSTSSNARASLSSPTVSNSPARRGERPAHTSSSPLSSRMKRRTLASVLRAVGSMPVSPSQSRRSRRTRSALGFLNSSRMRALSL